MGIELEFTEGMQFDKGYISAYFVTDPERMEAVLEDAYLLLSGGKISSMAEFLPLLERIAQSKKPNVVFILADNVGYADLGPYGGGELRGAPTPRIDQLATEGLRLTQFLVEPACTPSRAALMTGRYSIREGLSLILVPGGPNTLSARSVTMGE